MQLPSKRLRILNQPQRFFLLENGTGRRLKAGRNHQIREDFGNDAGQCFGHRAVADNHAAKGRLLVGLVRLVPSGPQILCIGADTAGVGVFQNPDRGEIELENEFSCGFNIKDIRITQVFAMQLLEKVAKASVEGGCLVRVVAIPQHAVQR